MSRTAIPPELERACGCLNPHPRILIASFRCSMILVENSRHQRSCLRVTKRPPKPTSASSTDGSMKDPLFSLDGKVKDSLSLQRPKSKPSTIQTEALRYRVFVRTQVPQTVPAAQVWKHGDGLLTNRKKNRGNEKDIVFEFRVRR